jgi:hypothetical protein
MSICFLAAPFLVSECLSQVSSQTQQKAVDKEEAEMIEDLDAKIDKTVQVLGVIKEELEDYKKEKAKMAATQKTVTAPGEEPSLADNIRGKLKTAIRIWKKVREVVKEETQAGQQGAYTTVEPGWAKDLDSKLDQAIETIGVIREELKEAEEDK